MNSGLEAEPTSPSSDRLQARLRVAAVLALAAAAAAGAVFFLLREDSSDSTPPVAAPPVATRAPEAVSLEILHDRAARAEQPIYWVGARARKQYELTETPDGSRIYVRYLPLAAPVGAKKPFLTVATYRMSNAFKATQAVSKLEGATAITVADGGVAFYTGDRPTSVYLAFPDSNYQIEVFHPQPKISQELVRSGGVRPIR